MKKIAFALAACSLGGCSGALPEDGDPDGLIGTTQEELDVTQTRALTKRQGSPLDQITDENARGDDTDKIGSTNDYYGTVGINADGSKTPNNTQTISLALNTLTKFRTRYGFASGEQVTRYFNRGDLGIGREMHCVDKINTTSGEIACYVTNFAAGDDGTEFIFGLSSNIAFANMDNNHAFATVGMVYRDTIPVGTANRVFFVVWDGNGALQNFAALDRSGFNGHFGPDFSGSAGFTYNNHVPSNCAACHGGVNYNITAHTHTGGLFLPFDLEQFDFRDAADKNNQLTAFKHQNEMVWKVAARTGGVGGISVKNQLNAWYTNTAFQSPAGTSKSEVFENGFNPEAVVTQDSTNHIGWAGFEPFYNSVVKPTCRNCHVANQFIPFDTEASFRSLASVAVNDICTFVMPHALQTVRQFWQSERPTIMETYLRGAGLNAEADQLKGCSPGNVATLDFPLITSAAVP